MTLDAYNLPDSEPTHRLNLVRTQPVELPRYDVEVVERTTFKDPEVRNGHTYHQELVRFSDGAVRELSVGIGDSDITLTGRDALFTGVHGFNRDTMTKMVDLGYNILWLHHESRHSGITRKGIGRSAEQEQAMLDDITAVDTSVVVSIGDSRSSMDGESADARAPEHDRRVVYSDYTAQCFEHRPGLGELVELARELPKEPFALLRIAREVLQRAVDEEDPGLMVDYMGTIDLHPRNVAHELSWIPVLMSGEAGKEADAIPEDQQGMRTLLERDAMSQPKAWIETHADRPGITIQVISGDRRHLDLAAEEVQLARLDRMKRFMCVASDHDQDLLAITDDEFKYVKLGESE